MESGNAYPATLTITTPERVDNWRPLVHWLLVIPHAVVAYALGLVSTVVAVISWFAILFTGQLSGGLSGYQSLYIRYVQRMYAFAGFLATEYPPFTFDTTPADPEDYEPVQVAFQPAAGERNRLTTLFRWVLGIPHAVVLAALGILAWAAWIVAGVAVLFTGTWPDGLRNLVLGYLRWSVRFNAYMLLLTDEYPPFSLDRAV